MTGDIITCYSLQRKENNLRDVGGFKISLWGVMLPSSGCGKPLEPHSRACQSNSDKLKLILDMLGFYLRAAHTC